MAAAGVASPRPAAGRERGVTRVHPASLRASVAGRDTKCCLLPGFRVDDRMRPPTPRTVRWRSRFVADVHRAPRTAERFGGLRISLQRVLRMARRVRAAARCRVVGVLMGDQDGRRTGDALETVENCRGRTGSSFRSPGVEMRQLHAYIVPQGHAGWPSLRAALPAFPACVHHLRRLPIRRGSPRLPLSGVSWPIWRPASTARRDSVRGGLCNTATLGDAATC